MPCRMGAGRPLHQATSARKPARGRGPSRRRSRRSSLASRRTTGLQEANWSLAEEPCHQRGGQRCGERLLRGQTRPKKGPFNGPGRAGECDHAEVSTATTRRCEQADRRGARTAAPSVSSIAQTSCLSHNPRLCSSPPGGPTVEKVVAVDQHDAARYERVEAQILAHRALFAAQGAVVASSRRRGNKRYGPYFRVAIATAGASDRSTWARARPWPSGFGHCWPTCNPSTATAARSRGSAGWSAAGASPLSPAGARW